jgi:hypothetical protein
MTKSFLKLGLGIVLASASLLASGKDAHADDAIVTVG